MTNVNLWIGSTPNYATVEVGPIILHFSYKTVIGYQTAETGLVVRENEWGPTTGKHLNYLDGGSKDAKSRRLNGKHFERELADIIARIDVTA